MQKVRHEEQLRHRSFTRRTLLLGGGMSAMLAALTARMYVLQVEQSDRFAMLAEDNRINLRLLPPLRGRILDRFGAPVAANRHNYRVLLVSEEARDLDAALDRLADILPLTAADRARIHREVARKRNFVPVTVAENLTWDQVGAVEVNAPDLPGVSIDVGQIRTYPYGGTMSHVLGYVGAVSEEDLTGDPVLELPGFRIGKNGIERLHDERLRGQAGTSHVEVNAYGRMIRELRREEGTPGQDVVLTLDAGLQNYVHQRLMGERSASAVVMDASNGDVLAMASVPSYDPGVFTHRISSTEWRRLTEDPLGPLSNKSIAGIYAPGSTFKMLVALAALEEGIDPSFRVWCPGHYTLGNHRFHCWKRQGHGWMNMHDAIVESCDVYFYDIARKLGVDRIAEVSKRFGLGTPTGIDLPGERGGVIPTRDWKLANIGEPWQGGETLVTSIGQGFVLTTPLQLAVMTARLVNGGRAVTPRMTRGFKLSGVGDEPLPAPAPDMGVGSPELEIIRVAMDAVVNGRRGTARGSMITEEGWEMGGKTGTSQVRRITKAERAVGVIANEDLPWRRRDHGLFVGYAPIADPRYVVSIVVEHGGGGSSAAAPIAKDILLEAQRRDPLGTSPLPLVARSGDQA
ncbi:penicillin-binding protein 2 [Algihabitans sp.]|uniref:penicillin-binding protein 2 n=1 Tax=Algihabitans sp. TaxID=2821514 RepID=UPI003BABE496